MRLIAFLVAALSVLQAAFALDIQKSVVVTYPHDVPEWVMDNAKALIRDAGGIVTHEYHLIRGFAANMPDKLLEKVKTMETKWKPVVEVEETMHTW